MAVMPCVPQDEPRQGHRHPVRHTPIITVKIIKPVRAPYNIVMIFAPRQSVLWGLGLTPS